VRRAAVKRMAFGDSQGFPRVGEAKKITLALLELSIIFETS
jgi:hypothetical protein